MCGINSAWSSVATRMSLLRCCGESSARFMVRAPTNGTATPQDERANDFPMLVFARSRDHFHHHDMGLQDAQESPGMQCEAAISSINPGKLEA